MGENLNNISKFKFWCHKILPLVYDDSLSYYEFLCKVVAKLNEVIELSEKQNNIITEFGDEIERWETSTDEKYAEFVKKVEDLIDAFEATIVEKFRVNERYEQGEYVAYEGNMYKAKVNVSGGVWNPNEWEQVVYTVDLLARVKAFEVYLDNRNVNFENEMRNQYKDFLDRYLETIGISRDTGMNEDVAVAQRTVSVSFANAIKGEESGGAVLCEDVSPVLHPVVVGVRSKNLIKDANSQTETHSGVTITPNGDGTFTLDGSATADVFYFVGSVNYKAGVEYTLSGCPKDGSHTSYMIYDDIHFIYDYGEGAKVQFSDSTDGRIYIRIAPGATIQNLVFKPMLETGTTIGAFTPGIPNGTAVKVTSAGRNLLNPAWRESTTVNGVTFTKNSDGSLTVNGVATGDIFYDMAEGIEGLLKPETSYYVSFGNSFVSNDLKVLVAGRYIGSETKYYLYGQGGVFNTGAEVGTETIIRIRAYAGAQFNNEVYYPILAMSPTEIPYEPFKAGQTIDTTVGSTIDLPSIAPYMSVYTDTEGTAVDVTYTQDTNKVIQNLVNAIISLGGTI